MATFELYNVDVDPAQVYQQYSQPPAPTPVPIVEGTTMVVTTINGASGPNINIVSSIGYSFTGGTGGNVVMTVSDAAAARAAISAAKSGVNTDITELNGATQVDVSGVYRVDGTQVVQEQGAAVPDATGGSTIDVEARAALNTLLARLRAHGLIAT